MKLVLILLVAACALAQTGVDLENRTPVLILKTVPEYTDSARQAALEGTVLLYVEIGIDGRAHALRVIRSLGMGLDEKAIEAVRQWRFTPALRNGKPARIPATLEVVFRLNRN